MMSPRTHTLPTSVGRVLRVLAIIYGVLSCYIHDAEAEGLKLDNSPDDVLTLIAFTSYLYNLRITRLSLCSRL